MERETIVQYVQRSIRESGMVGKLIVANTIVFLFFVLLGLVQALGFPPEEGQKGIVEIVKNFFIAPGNPGELLYKPWAIITHMFTHADFGHFFFNMIMLFFSGRIFVHFFGERRLLSTYIVGGIVAYIIHIGFHSFFPNLSPGIGVPNILGASAAIAAIFVAPAVYQPGFKVNLFGVVPVPLAVIAGFFVLSNLMGIGNGGQVAYIAHLGGALFGGLSVINAHSSKNIMNRLDRLVFKFKLGNFKPKKRKPKMKVYQTTETRNMTDDEYNSNKQARQERIDAILDKISKKGYDGLTKEEKDILFNESKR